MVLSLLARAVQPRGRVMRRRARDALRLLKARRVPSNHPRILHPIRSVPEVLMFLLV